MHVLKIGDFKFSRCGNTERILVRYLDKYAGFEVPDMLVKFAEQMISPTISATSQSSLCNVCKTESRSISVTGDGYVLVFFPCSEGLVYRKGFTNRTYSQAYKLIKIEKEEAKDLIKWIFQSRFEYPTT